MRNHGGTLAAVTVAGELVGTVDHPATFEEQFGTVRKSVLDRVRVEVLINVVAAEMSPAITFGFHRPGVLHPAAFVDVVNQEVAESTAARPQESVEVLDLVHQLAELALILADESRSRGTGHSVSSQHVQFAQFPILDPLEQFATSFAVAAHQADADLQVLLDRLFVQGQHLASTGPVDSRGLFHENVQAAIDRVLEMDPAKRDGSRQDDDVTFLERIHGRLVGVEPDEFAFFGNVDQFFEFPFQRIKASLQFFRENIGHGGQFDWAEFGRQSVFGSSSTTSAGSDQSDLDRIGFAGINVLRDHDSGERRCGGNSAGCFEKIAARYAAVRFDAFHS